jgi:hypothetical protein
MKITVSDDRPPIVPILAVGLLAGIVAVAFSGVLGVAGMGETGLRTLLSIGLGLLVGLLLKDRFVAFYRRHRGTAGDSEADADTEEPESAG